MQDIHHLTNTVVVPLDGSGYADRALGPAKALAARLGVGIGAVKVVDDQRAADRHNYLVGIARSDSITEIAR